MVFLNNFRALIFGWWIRYLEGVSKVIWQFLLVIIRWVMWKKRNKRIFEDRLSLQEGLYANVYEHPFLLVSISIDFDELEWYYIWRENL